MANVKGYVDGFDFRSNETNAASEGWERGDPHIVGEAIDRDRKGFTDGTGSDPIAKLAGIGTLAVGLACSGVTRPPPEPAPAAAAPSLEAWFEEGLATYEAHYDQWVVPLPEGGEFDGTLAVPPAERDWLRRWVGEQVDAGPFSPELKAELRARAANHEASGPCGLGCALTDSDDGTHATDLELVAGSPSYALLSTSLPGLDYLVVRLELRDGQVVRAERVTDVDAYALLDGEPADGAGH